MNTKPPPPVSKAFLVCGQVVDDTAGNINLLGLPRAFEHHNFPAAGPLGVFARWTSAHGTYQVEVQLQTPDGAVVWRDGPPEPWPMNDPLKMYDLKLNVCVAFPEPGPYDLVLLANGVEVARQPYPARLTARVAAT